jgi:hypothetical protein
LCLKESPSKLASTYEKLEETFFGLQSEKEIELVWVNLKDKFILSMERILKGPSQVARFVTQSCDYVRVK